jgi:Phosphate-selective porin O and P
MKHLTLVTLALAALAPIGAAQSEGANDEWANLDAELASLNTMSVEEFPGPYIWGYVRTNWAVSDELVVGPGDNKLNGFNLDNVRLNASGESHGFEYRITAEALTGTLFLEDAWASFHIGEEISTTLGRFRTPFLRSGTIEARDLLFISRTRNGVFYAVRDEGVMLNGDHGRLHWAAAAHNGADGNGEDWLTTLNVKVNLAGEDELPWEGAYHAGPGTRLSTGVSVSDDGAASDGTAWAIDLYLVHKGFSVQAEWLDYGQDYDNVFVGEQRGGTNPYSITTSYMVVPEKYELAVRFDDFDDERAPQNYKRQTLTLGLNRYVRGHDLKWQLNYADARKSGVTDGPHERLLALGLTFSF